MRVFCVFMLCWPMLSTCNPSDDVTNVITPHQRVQQCSTHMDASLLVGAVMPVDVTWFAQNMEDAPCGARFVDLYLHANGICTDALKQLFPACAVPAYAMECYQHMRKDLLNLPIIVPGGDIVSSPQGGWMFSHLPIARVLDESFKRINTLCLDFQGPAIELLMTQLRHLPVVKDVANRFGSLEEAKRVQREIAKGKHFWSLGMNCFRTLGSMMDAEVIEYDFPFITIPYVNLDPAKDGQRVDCDQTKYDECFVLAAIKAEAGHKLTNLYSYKFSAAALDARKKKGSAEYERVDQKIAFDKENPYPIMENDPVESITFESAEMAQCGGNSVIGGLSVKDAVQQKSILEYETSVDTSDLINHAQASFQLTGHVVLKNMDSDRDIRCQTATHSE